MVKARWLRLHPFTQFGRINWWRLIQIFVYMFYMFPTLHLFAMVGPYGPPTAIRLLCGPTLQHQSEGGAIGIFYSWARWVSRPLVWDFSVCLFYKHVRWFHFSCLNLRNSAKYNCWFNWICFYYIRKTWNCARRVAEGHGKPTTRAQF